MKHFSTPQIAKFSCLQADCPDTCCKGWSMQLDDATFAKYQGTDLENAVAYDGADKQIRVMKRDENSDFCVKFSAGKCGIHATKGPEMLSDACNFYPRIIRQIGDNTIITAALSCPEIARLMLFENADATEIETSLNRIPSNLKNYGDSGAVRAVHATFLSACQDNSATPECLVARIFSAAKSLQYIPQSDWENAASFMLKRAEEKLPQAGLDKADFYKIIQIFAGLVHATGKTRSERLSQTLEEISLALGVQINWQTLDLQATTPSALDWTISRYTKNRERLAPILRNFVASQLSFSSFPFAGLGDNILDKAKILSFRFAITRLALMALPNNATEIDIVRVVQSLSRTLDHLSDATLMLNLYTQSGWTSDAKIRGLIGDF